MQAERLDSRLCFGRSERYNGAAPLIHLLEFGLIPERLLELRHELRQPRQQAIIRLENAIDERCHGIQDSLHLFLIRGRLSS